MTANPAAWNDPKFHEHLNQMNGLTFTPRPMEPERFARLQHRVSEMRLIDPGTLMQQGAVEAFRDARQIAIEFIEAALASNEAGDSPARDPRTTAGDNGALAGVVGILAESVVTLAGAVVTQGEYLCSLAHRQ